MKKKRLDILLVERGLAESRTQAQRLTMAGEVIVEGQMALKPGQTFNEEAVITLKAKPPLCIPRRGEIAGGAGSFFPDRAGWCHLC